MKATDQTAQEHQRAGQPAGQPTPGDILMDARRADHLAHCTDYRERAAASAAATAENGASVQRRDRLTLGLRVARTTAVAR